VTNAKVQSKLRIRPEHRQRIYSVFDVATACRRIYNLITMRSTSCLILLALLLATHGSSSIPISAEQPSSTPQLPGVLTDIDGRPVYMQKLATEHRLVVVTLKATWCSVCTQQLIRLRDRNAKFQACGIRFVIVSPGPLRELKSVAERTRLPYPFVEDVDLDLARSLGLVLAEDQIVPALLLINSERRVSWMQRGRNPAYFGDTALLQHLDCATVRTATTCPHPSQQCLVSATSTE